MKNFWLLAVLLMSSFLLVWCDNTTEPEVTDDCLIAEECDSENSVEDFIAYYDDWSIREKGQYINGLKQWIWITYDENWNVINMEEYEDWELVENEPEKYDIMNDENLLKLYPDLAEQDWNIIIWDTLQTNYVEWEDTLYYDPYRWIALKIGEEFNWWLIREVDTDEDGYPKQEIIFLIKWDENEENRTWINWYREIFAITAISKENIENFKVTPDFEDKIIWENNEYYFISESDNSHYSNLSIFDVEE